MGTLATTLPVVAVHHHHELVAAAQEQPFVLRVEGQARRLLARGNRPRVHHLVRLGVNDGDLALVLQVVIDPPRAWIRHGKLRLAGQRDGGHDFTRLRLEHRRRVVSAR